MNASSVKSSTASAVGTLNASDSSFAPDPSQYDGNQLSGGPGPAASVHVLWDLGASSALSRVLCWASGVAEAWSSGDGSVWTDLGPAPSSGLTVAGSARYIQFTLAGANSQIHETQIVDGSGTVVGAPVPPPAAPGAPGPGANTTSSISVVLPALPTRASSLTLRRAMNGGAFAVLTAGITTGNAVYIDSVVTGGNVYVYTCSAVGPGGESAAGAPSAGTRVTDISLSASPSSLFVPQGRTVDVTLSAQALNGFSGTVGGWTQSTPGFSVAYSPLFFRPPGSLTARITSGTAPGLHTLVFSANGDDGGTEITRTLSIALTVTTPLSPDPPNAPTFLHVTDSSAVVFAPDLPLGASGLDFQTATGGVWTTITSGLAGGATLTLSSLPAGATIPTRFLADGPGGQVPGIQALLHTRATALPLGTAWTPTGPALRFGPRVPTGGAPLAFLDLPDPDPAHACALVDLSKGAKENGESHGLTLAVSGTIPRDAPGPRTSFAALPLSLSIPQAVASSPLRVTTVEQGPDGGWRPLISRGLTFRVLVMQDDARSWLWKAGFRAGQRLLCAYTSETDWGALCSPGAWGGWDQHVRQRHIPDSGAVTLSPFGVVGGLCTEGGVELLAGRSASGTAGAFAWSAFSASQDPALGRVRGAIAASSGETSALAAGADPSALSAPVSQTVYRFSGSVFAAAEGFYDFTASVTGRLRLSLWNCPLQDLWYGASAPTTVSASVYLHAGWHAVALEAAPDSGPITFSASGPSGAMPYSSGAPIGSSVTALDYKSGVLRTSRQGTTPLLVSYASPGDCPLRGFFDDLGTWRPLDLNPAPLRTYGDGSPTSGWLFRPCFIYAVPSLALALSDQDGIPILPRWVSSAGLTRSLLRWGRPGGDLSTPDGSVFGAASFFGGAQSGASLYGGGQNGVATQAPADLTEGYLSALPLALIDVSDGLPDVSSVPIQDARVLGGGLGPGDRPWTFSGPARARAETHWDLSPWDGTDSVAGRVLVRVPSAYLSGADGMVAFPHAEVEALVRESVAAGIEPILEIV